MRDNPYDSVMTARVLGPGCAYLLTAMNNRREGPRTRAVHHRPGTRLTGPPRTVRPGTPGPGRSASQRSATS
ncbi:hypothetical protein RKD18_000370 [Streptomyces phaeoluteigriseus]